MQSAITTKSRVIKVSLIPFLKYFLYAILFLIFCNSKIMSTYSPTTFGFFVALIFLNENIFYTSTLFLLSQVLVNGSIYSIIFSLVAILICGVAGLINKKRGRVVRIYEVAIFSFIVGLSLIYFKFDGIQSIYINLIDNILNTFFACSVVVFVRAMKNRRFNFNLNVDEFLCGGVALVLLFCSLQSVNFAYFDVLKFFGILIIFFGGVILPSYYSIIFGVICGIGSFVCNGGLEYITLFSIIAIIDYIFKDLKRIYQVFGVIIADIVISLLLGVIGFFSFIPTIVAGIIFLCVKSSLINKIKHCIFLINTGQNIKNLLNQNRDRLAKKLEYTSQIFYEMDKNFRKMVKGKLDKSSAKEMICNEAIRENCENCKNRLKCIKSYNSEHKKVFENLINIGFEKNKISLIDLPQYLTTRCIRLNQVVMSINSLLQNYKNYAKVNAELDNSKILIAEQLKGISKVLNLLSLSSNEKVLQNKGLEQKLKESLAYENIVVGDIVCFERDETTCVVSLTIRKLDYNDTKITDILSKVLNYKIVREDYKVIDDLVYASYASASTYGFAVGVAKLTKAGSTTSGDKHSMLKLSNNKYLLAICDGMGSGKTASEKSENSLSLLENFYRAGFDEETIINSLNKLLNFTSEGVFSALDVSVIDLKSGETDFIKQGAVAGYIKSNEDVVKIDSSALPLGILDDVNIKITKTVLTPDDFIIMVSDGVADALSGEVLEEYIKYLPKKSPQEIADCILNKAKLSQKNYPQDDMTVLVGKLYYNCA